MTWQCAIGGLADILQPIVFMSQEVRQSVISRLIEVLRFTVRKLPKGRQNAISRLPDDLQRILKVR